MSFEPIVALIRGKLPKLMAVYAFGSRIQGPTHSGSDLNLPALVEGYADPIQLWNLSGDLANLAGCDVYLLDFRKASTVMQYEILTTGKRQWASDYQVDIYEAAVCSEKTELETARAGIIRDIEATGKVYGR